MKVRSLKLFTLALIGTMTISSFMGCTKSKKDDTAKTNLDVTETNQEFTYPIQGDKSISINWGAGGDVYDESEMEDWYKEYNWMKRLKEETGVTLNDVGGKYGSATPSDEFMLLLASGEYPDVFRANWITFPGGPNAAMEEDYIIPLNDIINQYMPNFKKYLDENEDIAKMVRTDDGIYYALPVINVNPEPAMGLILRKDWLDQLGLSVPETLDELHTILVKFKEELNCTTPFTFELRWLFQQYGTASLSSAYDVLYPFYVENKTVKFGPLEDTYKEFLSVLHDWYTEGLLDADIASIDKNTVQSKFASGDAGACIQMLSNVKNCVIANEETKEQYEVVSVPTLVKNTGDEKKFCSYNGIYTGDSGFSISTACKDIETVARWMDFMYSEQGDNILKYGTEGVTYNIVDGKVTFTDFILNNPNEANPATVLGYVSKTSSWPQVIANPVNVREPYENDIIATWSTKMEQYLMPAVTFTDEEAAYINANYTNVDTYARETITKYVLGTQDLSTYDKFAETLKDYGIDTILEYRQTAYDRYIAR